MRLRSAEFDAALAKGATIIAKADLYRGSEWQRSLPVIEGSWSEDQTALIRSSCSITLGAEDPADVIPSSDPNDTTGVWPTGNEIQLSAGVCHRNGTEEYIDLGRFRISKPKAQLDVDGGVLVTVDGYDRMRSVSRARFTQPYTIGKGLDYATEMKKLLHSRLPFVNPNDFQFIKTDGSIGPKYTTPGAVFLSDIDPAQVLSDMAKAIGCELFFDAQGYAVLRQLRDPSKSTPEMTYEEGEDATILTGTRDLDDEQAYNGVIVTGTNSDGSVIARGEAWDTDPQSPTYYDPAYPTRTTYGPVPFFIVSEFVANSVQALAAARANLPRQMGVIEAVAFDAVPHFAHQAGDVIKIELPRIGATGIYSLESFSCGITHAGTMSATTRKRQLS